MEQMITPPERPASPPRRQRACVPCTKAKARCYFDDLDSHSIACERCQRIGTKCIAKSTTSLRKPRQIRPLNNRVSSLEQRLDVLTRTLEAREDTITRLVSQNGNTSRIQTPQSTFSTTTHDTEMARNVSDIERCGRRPVTTPSRLSQLTQHSSSPPFGLTWVQADRALNMFRREFTINFPFVIIPEHMTAKELIKTKPALCRAVILVSAPLPSARLDKIKRNVLAYLSQQIIVEDQRDVELLQALLVVIAWADLGGLYDQQITNLSYMAVGYAHNLGITKIPHPLLSCIGIDGGPEDIKSAKKQILGKLHSAEEQRCFLGLYCMISANSTQFGRRNTISSQYVELCCEGLEKASEFNTDFLLTQLVRMTHIGERIAESFGPAFDDARGRPFLFLLDDHVSAMRIELDTIMSQLSLDKIRQNLPHLPESEIINLHSSYVLDYQYLLVRLYEPATYLKPTAEEATQASLHRADSLQKCLRAVKDFFDTLFSVPSEQYASMPITFLTQITVAMIIGSRLILMPNGPHWDVHAARKLLNFETTLKNIIGRTKNVDQSCDEQMERFARETGMVVPSEEAEPIVLSKYQKIGAKTKAFTAWFEARMQREAAQSISTPSTNTTTEWAAAIDLSGAENQYWFGGLLENAMWSFNDFEMP